MEFGYRLYSRRGIAKERISAKKIKSASNARKLGPFVDEAKYPLVWVNWSKPKANGKKTKPYFRRYPQGRIRRSLGVDLRNELEERQKKSESAIHEKVRLELTDYLNNKIQKGEKLNWSFIDREVSDFSLVGNLLSEAHEVVSHYKYKTPFGIPYEFDIAILGKTVSKEKMILGVIEIEKTHRFGFLKLLVSKCLGFPLLSINIEDEKLENIDQEWCEKAISETTKNSIDGLRRNYIYLHSSLYPVYLNIPDSVRRDTKHQFLIYCREDGFNQLFKYIKGYRKKLNLSDKDVQVQPNRINYDNRFSRLTSENEGSIAGDDWKKFNESRYIRVSLPVPHKKEGNLYLFHLILARLCNSHFDCLVGYKYCRGLKNYDQDEDIWTDEKGYKIVQKNLTEPVMYLIEHLGDIGIIEKINKNPAANFATSDNASYVGTAW